MIYEKIRNSYKVNYGYNAYTESYCDMLETGIVDPTKVTRSALELSLIHILTRCSLRSTAITSW